MDRAERARRTGGAALVWARRLVVAVGTFLFGMIGLVVGVVVWILGGGGTAVLAGLLIGAGIGYLLTQLAVAHGHRLAPLAIWAAEKRVKGVGTVAIALAVLRRVMAASGRGRR